MNKTVINRNYSLLVLILLILYITYISIPYNTNMLGGANPSINPYDNMDPDKLNEKLLKFSKLYKLLYDNFTVYTGIVVILLLIALYYGYIHYKVLGVPASGINPVISWDNQGVSFLLDFFYLARHKYGIAPGKIDDPRKLENFEENAQNMINAEKKGVDKFCNIVAPCNICECGGPDQNYGGDPLYAPKILYGGSECVGRKKENFIEGLTSPDANNLNDYAAKYDYSTRILPKVNCCCHIFKKYGITTKDKISSSQADAVTKLDKTSDITKLNEKITPIQIDTNLKSLELPVELGCEVPSNEGKGSNYIFTQFQSCLSTNKIEYKSSSVEGEKGSGKIGGSTSKPFEGWTYYEKNIAGKDSQKGECFNDNGTLDDIKLGLDYGLSANFIFRNEKIWKKIQDRIKIKSENLLDLREYTNSVENTNKSKILRDTWWKNNGGPDWPFSSLFTDSKKPSINIDFYYNAVDNKKYTLKIDNYLYEVYLYPVSDKYITDNASTLKPITTTPEIIAFLEKGLTAIGDEFIKEMDGSISKDKDGNNLKTLRIKNESGQEIIPPRYLNLSSGEFIFP